MNINGKNKDYKMLLERASIVMKNSYSPYSGIKVGAAVLTYCNKIFTGTNVESASYGLTLCAERVAVAMAVANGCRKIKAIAIVAEKAKFTPCGACRQMIYEFSDDNTLVLSAKSDDINDMDIYRISDLLPKHFCL